MMQDTAGEDQQIGPKHVGRIFFVVLGQRHEAHPWHSEALPGGEHIEGLGTQTSPCASGLSIARENVVSPCQVVGVFPGARMNDGTEEPGALLFRWETSPFGQGQSESESGASALSAGRVGCGRGVAELGGLCSEPGEPRCLADQ